MSAKTIKLFTTAESFNTAITAMNKKANALNLDIQLLLASAVLFAVKDGNTNPLDAVIMAAGRGVRKTAIAQWALAHAPVVMNDNKETMKEHPFKFSRDKLEKLVETTKPDAEQAQAYAESVHEHLWTDHKEPPLVPESWSVQDAIKKVLAQAKTFQGKNVKIHGGDLLAQLEAMTKAPEDVAPV